MEACVLRGRGVGRRALARRFRGAHGRERGPQSAKLLENVGGCAWVRALDRSLRVSSCAHCYGDAWGSGGGPIGTPRKLIADQSRH